MYKQIKSNYILSKIKGRKWRDRGYVDDLLILERHFLGKSVGMAGHMAAHFAESRHPNEARIIWKELNPKSYGKAMREEAVERKKLREWGRELNEEDKRAMVRLKREWRGCGGRE